MHSASGQDILGKATPFGPQNLPQNGPCNFWISFWLEKQGTGKSYVTSMIICYKYDQWVALQLFLHLLTSVYVFVRLYTRRHLLALVSYRSLTIWSDDYSTPPYKPTVQRRTQTLQTRTQTVQTMEHCVLKQTIPSTLHQEHTTSYMARYVHASYPIHS